MTLFRAVIETGAVEALIASCLLRTVTVSRAFHEPRAAFRNRRNRTIFGRGPGRSALRLSGRIAIGMKLIRDRPGSRDVLLEAIDRGIAAEALEAVAGF